MHCNASDTKSFNSIQPNIVRRRRPPASLKSPLLFFDFEESMHATDVGCQSDLAARLAHVACGGADQLVSHLDATIDSSAVSAIM